MAARMDARLVRSWPRRELSIVRAKCMRFPLPSCITPIVTAARPRTSFSLRLCFRVHPASPPRSSPRWTTSPPTASRPGGSTFKNPPGNKAWQLIDAAGCRGLRVGGAHVSEMHCNFLINEGEATGADIEELGEMVRARVKAHSGIELEWEIKRLGVS